MGEYRAYILDIDGERFVGAKEFPSSHPDHAAALNAAKQLADKHDVEVWQGSKLLARLSPSGEVSPALAPGEADILASLLSPSEEEAVPELAPSLPSEDSSIKPADGEEEVVPGSAPPPDCENSSDRAERISLKDRVKELALAILRR